MLNDLDDTTITDTSINTVAGPWSYKVDLYYNNAGVPTLKEVLQMHLQYSEHQSDGQRLNLTWEEYVPWTNNTYDIYRLNPATLIYDSMQQ